MCYGEMPRRKKAGSPRPAWPPQEKGVKLRYSVKGEAEGEEDIRHAGETVQALFQDSGALEGCYRHYVVAVIGAEARQCCIPYVSRLLPQRRQTDCPARFNICKFKKGGYPFIY